MAVNLVGRNDAMRGALALLARSGVVVLAGASGVGKTALARELVSSFPSSVEIKGTHGLKSVPFAALAPVLTEGLADADNEEVSAGILARLVQSGNETHFLVDDAHLLDEASAAVVSHFARVAETKTVLTVTSGEPVPADLVTLWAEDPKCRIDLEPLTRDEVGEMVRDLMGGTAEDKLVDRVAEVTLGYPLYVAALVEEMRHMGVDDVAVESSDRLVGLFERRIGRLSRDERRLFDSIAFAETLPMVSMEDRTLETLEGLEAAGLVDIEAGKARVSHPLLGAVARSTLTPLGLRACATQLVEGLTDEMEEVDVAALVRKALSVGIVAKADHLETAARVAFRVQDFEGTVAIAGLRPDEPALVALRAQALRYLGEVPDSVPIDLDDTSLAEFVSARAQAMAYGEGRYAEAIDLLVDAMAQLEESGSRDRIALELVILSGLSGDVDTLLGAARAVSADADADTRLLALSSTLVGEALTLSTATSTRTYEQARALLGDVTDAFHAERLEMSNGLVQGAEGRFRAAREILERGDEPRGLEGSWLTIEAVLAEAWMSTEEAGAVAEQAVAALQQFDALGNLPLAQRLVQLRATQLGRDRGPFVEASLDLSQADEVMEARVEAWNGWSEDRSRAAKSLIDLGREAVSLGHRMWGLLAFLDAIRLGHGSDVAADVEHMVISRGAGLAIPVSRQARAESADDYWSCARDWWSAGASTYAVEAAACAAMIGEPIHRAGAQLLVHRGAVPLIANGFGPDEGLSDRQVEIALGAAGGKSNEDLAESLYLSRRTVENHLYRIYQALELADGRDELVDKLGWTAG